MGNFKNRGKLCLQLYVIMCLVNKLSAAALGQEKTYESSSADPNDDGTQTPRTAEYNNRPLIPPASVSANIAQLTPSMSTPKRQSQIIIR